MTALQIREGKEKRGRGNPSSFSKKEKYYQEHGVSATRGRYHSVEHFSQNEKICKICNIEITCANWITNVTVCASQLAKINYTIFKILKFIRIKYNRINNNATINMKLKLELLNYRYRIIR